MASVRGPSEATSRFGRRVDGGRQKHSQYEVDVVGEKGANDEAKCDAEEGEEEHMQWRVCVLCGRQLLQPSHTRR
jgi:hypothetical protein